MATKKKDEAVEETKPEATETVEAVKEEKPKKESKAKTAEKAEAPKKAAKKPAKAETSESDSSANEPKKHKRAEKVGVVWSDKMTKTVVVRVDRLVKHPLYHKYMKRRKKFMAHDELGATTGDRVRIVETRPLSARKRWRVVEILQKAEK